MGPARPPPAGGVLDNRVLRTLGLLCALVSLTLALKPFLQAGCPGGGSTSGPGPAAAGAGGTGGGGRPCPAAPAAVEAPSCPPPARCVCPSCPDPQPVRALECPACQACPAGGGAVGSGAGDVEDAQLWERPPPGLRVYVYDLPAPWERGLLEKYSECNTYQWVAEAKLPRLLRGLGPVDGAAADWFLVPFLSKCYFNHVAKMDRTKMNKVFLEILAHVRSAYPYWDRAGGRDHVFIFPSGIGASMFPDWRAHIRSSVFLLAEGDRTKDYINTYKDIIIPAVSSAGGELRKWKPLEVRPVPKPPPAQPKDCVSTYKGVIIPAISSASAELFNRKLLEARSRLLFFRGKFDQKIADYQGRTSRSPLELRVKLGKLLGGEKDVLFTDHRQDEAKYAEEASSSVFCACPRGSTPWTRRVYDAIFSGCIPVVLSDDIEFPFENFLQYDRFTVKVREEDALRPGHLLKKLRGMGPVERQGKIDAMARVRKAFVYDGGGALNAVLWELDKRRRLFKHGSSTAWD